jgi:hypothetical protein
VYGVLTYSYTSSAASPCPARRNPDGLHRGQQAIRVAVHDDGVQVGSSCSHSPAAPSLHQPEVEERDLAVDAEAVVARVRVAVERAEVVHGVLREPPDALARVLLGGGRSGGQELGEPDALHPLGGEHAFACWWPRRRSGCARTGDRAKCCGELALVGGLEAVVELVAHAVAQLVDQALGVEALQRERPDQPVQPLGVVEVGLDGVADARGTAPSPPRRGRRV